MGDNFQAGYLWEKIFEQKRLHSIISKLSYRMVYCLISWNTGKKRGRDDDDEQDESAQNLGTVNLCGFLVFCTSEFKCNLTSLMSSIISHTFDYNSQQK